MNRRRFFGLSLAAAAITAALSASAAAPRLRRVSASGRDALKTWDRLKGEGKGWPIIVGDDSTLSDFTEEVDLASAPADATIAAAARLRFPQDLPGYTADAQSAEVGEWPATPPPATPAFSMTYDHRGDALAKVNILIVPTDDPTTVPAHLQWGGWNECPAPEYHVAALRSWRDRYGAEIVALSRDVMGLRVQRRPETRDEALALAREIFAYCPDIVLQGTGTLSALAATLMVSDLWEFWWD